MEKDEFEKFINSLANIKIIIALGTKENCSYTDIAKISHITLSHVMKMVKMMVNNKILEIGKTNGREAQIKLSEKGKQVALKLNELRGVVNS